MNIVKKIAWLLLLVVFGLSLTGCPSRSTSKITGEEEEINLEEEAEEEETEEEPDTISMQNLY
jgi:hypothetical protein